MAIYSAGRSIEEIKKKYGLSNVIKLASNENNFGIRHGLLSFLKSETSRLFRYPDNDYRKLKASIASFHGVKEDNVMVGCGSDELLYLLARQYLDSGSEALIPSPSFQYYHLMLDNLGIPYRRFGFKGWKYDLAAVRKAVRPRTRMIILCNPNNPTGAAFSTAELEGLLASLPRKIMVICDEAYIHFKDDFRDCGSIGLLAKHKNLVILRTLSKFFSLAGLRMGFGLADRSVVAGFNRIKPPFSVNTLAENIGDVLFSPAIQKECGRIRDIILSEKLKMYEALDRLGVSYERTQTNFIFIHGLKDAEGIFEALLSRGIIVRYLSAFGIKDGLRVTVGKPSENKAFLKSFESVLKRIR